MDSLRETISSGPPNQPFQRRGQLLRQTRRVRRVPVASSLLPFLVFRKTRGFRCPPLRIGRADNFAGGDRGFIALVPIRRAAADEYGFLFSVAGLVKFRPRKLPLENSDRHSTTMNSRFTSQRKEKPPS